MKKILLYVFSVVLIIELSGMGLPKKPCLSNDFTHNKTIVIKPSEFCEQALLYFKYGDAYTNWVESVIENWNEPDQEEFFYYLDEHGVQQTVSHYNIQDSSLVRNIVDSWYEYSGVRKKLTELMYGNVDSITVSQYNVLLDSARSCYVLANGRIDPGECEDQLDGCMDYATDFFIDRLRDCGYMSAAVATFWPRGGAAFGIGCIQGAYWKFFKRVKNCKKDYKTCINS